MKTQIRKSEWTPARDFLPIILGKDVGEELEGKELKKLELFEKGLENELSKEDTISQAVTKIVRMALAAEFSPSFVTAPSAKKMIEAICQSILSDGQLRKQVLIIIDRFAHE